MRTFVCFELPDDVKDKLAALLTEARKFHDLIRWTPPSNVHLTFKFLGETTDNQLEAVSAALEKITRLHAPVNVTFDRLGVFPNFKTPRVFWVGVNETSNHLQELVSDLEIGFEDVGFEKENRQYRPHLTLGRTKDRHIGETLNFWRQHKIKPFTVRFPKIVLMESRLELTGAVYTPLKKLQLRGK